METPLDLVDAEEFCRLAEVNSRVLMAGDSRQHHPAFVELEQRVAAGVLGLLHYLHADNLNLRKLRRQESTLWHSTPHVISMIPSLVRGVVVVQDTVVVDEGVELGAGTRVWHFTHILAGSRLGRDCVVGQNVMIGPNVNIGDCCKIQNHVSPYQGLILENGVFCGPSCVSTKVNMSGVEMERKSECLPIVVLRGATIGANAISAAA